MQRSCDFGLIITKAMTNKRGNDVMTSTGIKKEERYKSYISFGKGSTFHALLNEMMMIAYTMIFLTFFFSSTRKA